MARLAAARRRGYRPVDDMAPMASIPLLAILAIVLLGAIVILVPLQMFGRWLQRKGSAMEQGRRPEAMRDEHDDPFGSD
jgi:hypothetical protein